jgi:alginate O-acetyltransferase complex protein AlgI
MVFSDKIFLFVFLPLAFLAFQLARRFASGTVSIVVLIAASAIFYSYWSVPFLFVLLAQILINYYFGVRLSKNGSENWYRLAIAFNLALLGYFKYRNFFIENVGALTGAKFALSALIVPLGISFHTFQQIALLSDVKDGETKLPPLLNYVFFVIFFPQLIAGPIVLHREMGDQVDRMRSTRGPVLKTAGIGLFLLVYGLWKKVCLADMLAPHVDLAYHPGIKLTAIEAWIAGIGYPLQLYMDFSGYSDMAVGLGLLFGFLLPNNFNIPFRATSMIDYWRRWHITMTRFFTMYVYMPLSLSLMRIARRRKMSSLKNFSLSVIVPTFVAFLASGLWHGAGWTFILFGVVNGVGLIVNHFWLELKLVKVPRLLAWLLTMATVMVTLIYFRAYTVTQANHILAALLDFGSLQPPPWLPTLLKSLHVSWRPTGAPLNYEWLRDPTEVLSTLGWIAVLGPLSLILPALSAAPEKIRPTWKNAFFLAAMALLSIGLLDQPRSFLYFAF